MTDENVSPAANALRETKNWLAVFKTEYDVADEAIEKLHAKLDEVGNALGEVSEESAQHAANALRDVKNWLAVFKEEYDLSDETVDVLHKKLDEVGNALATE